METRDGNSEKDDGAENRAEHRDRRDGKEVTVLSWRICQGQGQGLMCWFDPHFEDIMIRRRELPRVPGVEDFTRGGDAEDPFDLFGPIKPLPEGDPSDGET